MTASVATVGQWHLVTLSGPDPGAVDALSLSLARSLVSSTITEAVAGVGGKPGPLRRAVLARSAEQCARILTDPASEPQLTMSGRADGASMVMMFPGVGDQRSGMTRELYEHVPAFRSELDRLAELLMSHLGQDIRPLLHADAGEPADLDPKVLRRRGNAGVLTQTRLAQPIVFAVEYALARLLQLWGIRPSALCGYSIGEYVAACVAGVMGIEDALTLVARRAALIEDVPPGAMLVAMISPSALREYLGEQLWLAAVNGPNLSVIAGTRPAVANLAERLKANGIATLPASVRHGFHSPMMNPVSPSLESLLSHITLAPPAMPVLSNVTGGWLDAGDACSAAYWARHLCQTVHFDRNLSQVWQLPNALPIEVGPGQMLTALANQHPGRPRVGGTAVLSTLTTRAGGDGEVASLLAVLARAWVRGGCERITVAPADSTSGSQGISANAGRPSARATR